MKRIIALVGLAAIAGCGGGGESENKAAAVEIGSIAPGQYEVVREVTSFRATDNAPQPKINTPVGTRATETICVGAGAEPPGELFAGTGSECRYENHYLRRGRLNSSLVCRREGLSGDIRMAAYGTVTADGFEANVDTTTFLSGDGDSVFSSRVTGRRTGDCQAGAEEGNASGNASEAAKQ